MKRYGRSFKSSRVHDSDLPERVYSTGSVSSRALGSGEVKTEDMGDGQVTDSKIATGALRATKLDGDTSYFGTHGPIPDVSTEYAYGKTLVGTPKFYTVTPKTGAVEGYVKLDTLSKTSITLKANVSGVTADVGVWS